MKSILVKKAIVFFIFTLLLSISIFSTTADIDIEKQYKLKNNKILIDFSAQITIFVGGEGPGNYTKIQDAIDNATEGDVIFVYNGVYNESLIINKSNIHLIGENKENTIIDPEGLDVGIDIPVFSNNNSISGFTIRNTSYAGIYFHSNHPHKEGTCNNNTISDCIIHNIIGLPHQAGIRISGANFKCHTDYNNIENCTIYNTTMGIIIISTITAHASFNNIINSSVNNNENGIKLIGGGETRGNIITDCNIFNNSEYGICSENINLENIFYHNNLINNNQNTYDDNNTNFWYNLTLGEGNYYSDYSGEDNDGDGIGDTPYEIPGSINLDDYPLIISWGENPPIADFDYIIDGLTITFDGSLSFDRDGEIIEYSWDFGDGNNDTGIATNHTYGDYGAYVVTLTVTDNDDNNGNISKSIELESPNMPPTAPEINGETNGKKGKEYEYTFSATDPNEDDIRYFIDWGDNNTEWTEYFSSGEEVIVTHAWVEKGTYIITARAQDINGADGPDATLEVTMPKNKFLDFSFIFISWLLNHFPNAFPILNYMMSL